MADVEKICALHNEELKLFCRTDQICICYICVTAGCRGHDIVEAKDECTRQKEELGQSQRRCQQIIQSKEREQQHLRKAVKTLMFGADAAEEKCLRLFNEMINEWIQKRAEVIDLIKARVEAEVSRAEEIEKHQEQEIAEQKRRDAQMELLSQIQDPIYFLKKRGSINDEASTNETSWTYNQTDSFEPLKEAVSSLTMRQRETSSVIFQEEMVNISAAATEAQILNLFDGQASPEPVTREDFLSYSCHFTLDPDTAHAQLLLSEENMRVEWRDEAQSYPDQPDRFDGGDTQVLCREGVLKEGVSERCYWEVEWSGEWVGIAVACESIRKKGGGHDRGFGCNDQSWMLELNSNSTLKHDDEEIPLTLVASSRIGVYVDHRAGTLAFYSISDTMTLLHKVHTFTHTLYPGFWLYGGQSSVKLV